MKKLKDFWGKYSSYFVDVWQYLIILVIMILALIFWL